MSSMLEQAIIDAAALKEAALKNAEQEVLERYSKDIKKAVDALLEQEDPFSDEEAEEAPFEPAVDPNEDPLLADPGALPPAHLGGEKKCPCPDDDEVVTIEIDLDDLTPSEPEEATASPDQGAMDMEPAPEPDMMGDMGEEEEEEPLAEHIEFDEQELAELVEELVFDYVAQPSGNPTGLPVEDLHREQELQELAREIEEANNKKEELQESLKDSKAENNKLRRIVLKLKEKLDEVSVSNARLIYTNRVLGDDSLNERQKEKIVEKISEAQTIEEAKMIHEALQSTVAGTQKDEGPKSLNEAVSRQSTQVFSRRQRSETNHVNDQFFSRMQRLAGIKN